jgi:hypothetical protein
MAAALLAAGVAPGCATGPSFGELGARALDLVAASLLVRARLVFPPRAPLSFGVAARVAAAYAGAAEAAGGPPGAAAAGRFVASWATLAVLLGAPQWLWPLVAHAVAASELAPPAVRRLADPRLSRPVL